MTVRNRGALAALAAGVAALTVSTLVACGSQPAENVGADEASTLASTPATRRPARPRSVCR